MRLVHDSEIASFVNTAIYSSGIQQRSRFVARGPRSMFLLRQNHLGVKTGVHKSRVPGRRGDKFLRCRLIHPALVLSLFAPTPLANFNHYLICAHFWFYTLWLAALYYSKSLFLMGISFLIYDLFYLRPLFQERKEGDKQGLGVRADPQHGTRFMSLSLRIPYQNYEHISPLPHTCYIPRASNSS